MKWWSMPKFAGILSIPAYIFLFSADVDGSSVKALDGTKRWFGGPGWSSMREGGREAV